MSGAHERDVDPLTIRLRQRIGRRGCALLFFAMLETSYATSLVCVEPAPGGANAFLGALLPLWVWSVPWGVAAALCTVQAFHAEARAAFAVTSALSAGMAVLHVAGLLLGEISTRAFVGGAIWLAFAAFCQVIAGWPEAARRDRGV
jgi:hypothetical protein